MSLIVLNSQGQDPAEFENHFGRGLKLPRNAEICLVGANINRLDDEEGHSILQETNDGFVVLYGNPNIGSYAAFPSYNVKVAPGVYSPQELASQIIQALAVGNYGGSFNGSNYSDIPPSPLRLGLYCFYDNATKKMKFTVDRNYVYRETDDETQAGLRERYAVTCKALEGSPEVAENNWDRNPGIMQPWSVDPTFCAFCPQETGTDCLKVDNLWNGSNGAGILQPVNNSTYGGVAANRITPVQEYGYRWGILIDETVDQTYLFSLRGGIMMGSKVTAEVEKGLKDVRGVVRNRKDLKLDWSVGGNKWDLFWKVEKFTPAQAAPGTLTVGVYYMPTEAISNGKPWVESNAIKVGEGVWGIGGAALPNYCEIAFRPVDGKAGTDANAPVAPNANDARKCCIDFRVTVVPAAGLNAPAQGSVRNATSNGFPGYIAVDDYASANGVDKFCLYRDGGQIYMGCGIKHRRGIAFPPVVPPGDPEPLGYVMMKGIEHGVATTEIQSMSNIDGDPAYVTAPSVIAQNNFSFQDVTFAFSPLSSQPFASTGVKGEMLAAAKRISNIASTIGFNENQWNTLTSANSQSGLVSTYANENGNWEDKDQVCVIQMPNLSIEGELGSGSGVYGGANTANILGVIGLAVTSDSRTNVYHEPNFENYIKCKNLSEDSINQLKVKLTDVTGRKLIGLAPDSTIWIKIRCGKESKELKVGGVNPLTKPFSPEDRAYSAFY